MSKLLRKTRKLLKSPKAFFSDSMLFNGGSNKITAVSTPDVKKKTLPKKGISKNNNSEQAKNKFKFSDLIEDYITPHDQDTVLFNLLDKAGVNYHIVDTEWHHIVRIAIQDSFIKNVIELIKGSYSFTKEIYVVEGKSRYDLVKLYFHDDAYVYKNKIYQFDPWYITPHGVMTRNKNSKMQFVPKAHINKTVHSFAPIRLGKNILNIDNVESMLGVNSFLFDEYLEPIDIVYTWVSDSDPIWLNKKSFYLGKGLENKDTRFVDYEQLRYSLRSVAAYAKFIRKIFIVTDNQIPYWLDTEHEKIVIVNHTEIFDNEKDLPVFNSVAIESWIHKINGLSDNFIYANDDYFFGSPVSKRHFIHSNGIAKLFLEPIPNAYGSIFEDSEPTNQLSLFTAQSFYDEFGQWPSFWPLHAPMVKNIHAIEKMADKFSELIDRTSRSRFRESGTISPLYLMSAYFSYAEGYSVVSSIRYEYVSSDDHNLDTKLSNLLTKIKEGKCDVFCLNDHRSVTEMQITKVANFMKTAFPIPADWEIDEV